jgi:hypothetical protein
VSASSQLKRHIGVLLSATLLAIGAPIVAIVGTADASNVAAAGFVTSAKVDRTQATVGQSDAVTASVRSDTTRRALIDVEIYDRSGRKMFQRYWDNQSFTSGQTRGPEHERRTLRRRELAVDGAVVGRLGLQLVVEQERVTRGNPPAAVVGEAPRGDGEQVVGVGAEDAERVAVVVALVDQ